MDELGAYAVGTYKRHFDSWTNALRTAGYEPKTEFRVSSEAILEEIHRLADTSEKPPTAAEMRSDGKYSITATQIDILPALKHEDSHGTVPLGWDIVVYDVTRS